MQIIRKISGLAESERGAAVALGNFDGVHLGHQSVLALAREAAVTHDAPLGVITFEPHPRAFFAPDAPAFRLMNAETRAHRLAKLGVDILYEIPFNVELASLSAEAFARDVLARGLGVRHVVVGADFRFGKGRKGDTPMLRELGRQFGFGVTEAPLVSDVHGDYSSTAIREALSAGRPEDAARILGHWHRIDGIVQHGDKRGRLLGFPTINVSMEGLHMPKFGVYAVMVDVLEGPNRGYHPGAASIGIRPTFGVNHPNLEVYLLDFSGDLYDIPVSVALAEYIRPEEKFDSLDALVDQMKNDCVKTREILTRYGK